jgi:hypothetical protein
MTEIVSSFSFAISCKPIWEKVGVGTGSLWKAANVFVFLGVARGNTKKGGEIAENSWF